MTEIKGTIEHLQLSGLVAGMKINGNITPIFFKYGETENDSWHLLRGLKIGDAVELSGDLVELKSPKGVISGLVVKQMRVV